MFLVCENPKTVDESRGLFMKRKLAAGLLFEQHCCKFQLETPSLRVLESPQAIETPKKLKLN